MATRKRKPSPKRITLEQFQAHVLTHRLTPDDQIPTPAEAQIVSWQFERWLEVRIPGVIPVRRARPYGMNVVRMRQYLAAYMWGWRTPDHKPVRLVSPVLEPSKG